MQLSRGRLEASRIKSQDEKPLPASRAQALGVGGTADGILTAVLSRASGSSEAVCAMSVAGRAAILILSVLPE